MKTAVAYCGYADDFVVIVKRTKAQAMAVRRNGAALPWALQSGQISSTRAFH